MFTRIMIGAVLVASVSFFPLQALAGRTDPMLLIGQNIKGYVLTAKDVGSLEPVCVPIFLAGRSGTWYEVLKGDPILDRPPYSMAKGANSFHHYCYAEIAKIRRFKERDANKRKFLAETMLGEYGFVINAPEYRDKGWPYLKKVYVEYGRAALLLNRNKDAIGAFSKALQIDPAYDQAHIAIADMRADLGDKKGALQQVVEGLKHNPDSKQMKRRYAELGGKGPYPEPYQKPKMDSPADDAASRPADAAASNSLPADSPVALPEPSPAESAAVSPEVPDSKAPAATPTQRIGNEKNPYCRFCP